MSPSPLSAASSFTLTSSSCVSVRVRVSSGVEPAQSERVRGRKIGAGPSRFLNCCCLRGRGWLYCPSTAGICKTIEDIV
eukprot:9344858-Pyramimonas_sp.AAC.1